MLYRTLKRMIEKGLVEEMAEKLDFFYATNKITKGQYDELSAMLAKAEV